MYQKFLNNKWNIWIMDSNGNNDNQITTVDGDNTDGAFSPDSQDIVYSADGELKYANLYVIPTTDGVTKRLTYFKNGYDGAPSWSPNGKKVAFESSVGNPDNSKTSIWIINIPENF